MKKYLKSKLNNIAIKLILLIIILSLIFSTMNAYIDHDPEQYVAIVNGEKITLTTLQKMYFIEQEKQKKILSQQFFKIHDPKQFSEATYNYVLQQLINNILVEQYIKKIHFNVNNNQIKNILLNNTMFKNKNIFDQKKYFNYLQSKNLTNHQYIDIIKKKIRIKNFIRAIIDTDFVLETEKNNIVKLLSQKRQIKQATLKIQPIIAQQKVHNLEIINYFNQHKHQFYVPEKFKVRFLQLNLKNIKSTCTKKEIKEWYEKHIKKYFTQEERKYSFIQTKTKKEALLIISQLSKNKNFSKIAKEQSIDPISSKNGGNIGWIKINEMPSEIKRTHLNKKGQISQIIPFHNNFLIIKLNDIKPKKQKKMSQVFNAIKKEIQIKKSLFLYHKLQKKISYYIQKYPNQFDNILKNIHMFAKETGWFDKYSIPRELNVLTLKKIIFNKTLLDKQKKIIPYSKFVILNSHQSFLLNLKDFQRKKTQKIKNVKNNIIKILKHLKAIKIAKQKLKNAFYQLKKGNTNGFKKLHLKFSNSEVISRYDSHPIKSIVFSLPRTKDHKKRYAVYQDKNKNFHIIYLKKIYHDQFSLQEKHVISKYLERNNAEIILHAFLTNLKNKANIIYRKIEIE